jgi:pimeloyl-ACP methyl ester carboxylesterase
MHTRITRILAIAMALLGGPVLAEPAASTTEKWVGQIDMVQLKVDFAVTVTKTGEAQSATMSVPIQGLKDGALSDVAFGAETIRFTFAPPGAPGKALFTAEVAEDGQSAAGAMEQFGQKFAFTLRRATDAEAAEVGPVRPQTPKPPFPYDVREVGFRNEADGVDIACTLTQPQGDGPYPAVMLLTGSGAQDRDESIIGHKPFAVIADALTRRGVAVLRCDDRGVGGTTGTMSTSTAEDFARDALAGVAYLKSQSAIHGAKIGLLGHSEGGMVAPMAAAQSSDVAFIVLLAGPGLPGGKILSLQLEAVLRAAGVADEHIAPQLVVQKRFIEAIGSNAPADVLRKDITELMTLQSGGAAPKASSVDAQVAHWTSPWARSFIVLDPAVALRKVNCPVLALNGALDTQVPAEVNLKAIEAALKEADNHDVTVRAMPGLNHLFQRAQTGGVAEYAVIEETIAPEVLTIIGDWILQRVR